ncbi:MAG: 6,7-dimethyl-8-ribityllumazine synthase [Nitrososphaerota archaeon]|nr:6,7-dimethyl-8-ribityllumazine synthase [Candidatus Bathyarchaeota archaeon]MDW8194594.1 6,7-dimethyl-8-ribityllumazine synthase [Nitrososphaerota archaeon]
MQLGIVVSEFNAAFVERMLESAKQQAASLNVKISYVCRVPGCYEAPLAVKELLLKDDVDAVVVLGSMVKETSLEEYLFNQVVGKLMDLSLEYGKPVSLGVSGPGIYWDDGVCQAGAEAYAKIAVEAAVKMVKRLETLRGAKPSTYPLEVK